MLQFDKRGGKFYGLFKGTKLSKKYMTPIMQEHLKDMAPTYGEVAREVTKGVKDGLNE